MILNNLRVQVDGADTESLLLKTEAGDIISIPRTLAVDLAEGEEVFIAIDTKPMVSSEKQAKDILNEIIKE